MTVEENVAYPLRMAGVGKRERLARAGELLERVQLPGFGPRRVQTLSGGQAQRVALARALAAAPRPCCSTSPSRGSMRACATICARFCCACIERTA